MAQPVSYKKAPDDGADVFIELVEPSFHTNGGEQKGLYLGDGEPSKKIDYCLVYELCEEKESKDEEAKEKAEKLEGMRQAFEASLVSAGLVIDHKEHALPQVRPALIAVTVKARLAEKYILLASLEFNNIAGVSSLSRFKFRS